MIYIMFCSAAAHRHGMVIKVVLFLKRNLVSVLVILIVFSVLVAGGFLVAFLWSVRSGQYDDDYTPSVRMLFDDNPSEDNTTQTQNGKHAS